MKIRHGFVSNSSTSSFVIFGVALSSSELTKKLDLNTEEVLNGCGHKFDRKENNFCNKCGAEAYRTEVVDTYDLIEEEVQKLNLDIEYGGEYDNYIYVGLDIEGLSGQKGVNALSQTNKQIKEIFGKDATVYSVVREG